MRSGEEVTKTTEETTKAVEEGTAATADPAVAWAMGASSRQVGQDWWRQGRFDDGVIRQGTRDALSRTVAITARRARLAKATAYSGGHCG